MFSKLLLLLIVTITSCLPYAELATSDPNHNAEMTDFLKPNISWLCSGELCPASNKGPKELTVDYFSIKSYITHRYATTYVMSQITNRHTKDQKAEFSIFIPSGAHISRLTVQVDKELYDSKVDKRKKQLKPKPIRDDDGGGPLRKFEIKTKLKPNSRVIYHLVYEELLVRKNGQYTVDLNVHLGQIVKNLDVQVLINENQPIRFVKIPMLMKPGDLEMNIAALNPHEEIVYKAKSSVVIRFRPTPEQQVKFLKALNENVKNGLDVQFRVNYDVQHNEKGGELITNGPYFVHFFAPEHLKPLPKYVIFVLDTSGSMAGSRMKQLRLAMEKILPQLKPNDLFSIIKFASDIEVVDIANKKGPITIIKDNENVNYEKFDKFLGNRHLPDVVHATKANIDEAIKQVNSFKRRGETNIITSSQLAVHMVKKAQKTLKTKFEPMIMLVTDGQPGFKEQTTGQALKYITEYNNNIAPIFSVGISPDAYYPFLKQLSALNRGTALYIKNVDHISVLLERFFDVYSRPVLNNIRFKYGDKVTALTQTHFITFYEGTEYVVAGKIENLQFKPQVLVQGQQGEVKYIPHVSQSATPLDRIWAYLKTYQNIDELTNKKASEQLLADTLKLALEYSFVTPLSSLFVLSPGLGKVNDDTLLHPAYEPIKDLSSTKINVKQTKAYPYLLPFELSKQKLTKKP